MPPQGIGCFAEHRQPGQNSCDIQSVLNRCPGYSGDLIADVDFSAISGRVGLHIDRDDVVGAIFPALVDPGDAIVGKKKLIELLKINDSRKDSRSCQN